MRLPTLAYIGNRELYRLVNANTFPQIVDTPTAPLLDSIWGSLALANEFTSRFSYETQIFIDLETAKHGSQEPCNLLCGRVITDSFSAFQIVPILTDPDVRSAWILCSARTGR